MALTVWAVDSGRVRRGHLVPLECTAVLRDADVGTFQVTVPASDELSRRMGPGWRVVIQDDDQTVLSGPLTEVAESVADSTRTLTGVSDLQHVQDRTLFGDPSKVWTQQTADGKYARSGPAETVIRDIVHANVGTGAVAARRQDGFTVTSSQGRGKTVKVNDRDKPVLEVIRPLARSGGVTFDAVQEQDSRIVFRFRVPVDRSRAVRFTAQNGGLTEGSYSLVAPTVNVALAAGQGAGTYLNRREYIRATSWGRRVEEYLDQTSTDDDPEIKQAADELLDEGREGATASITAQEVEGCRYGTDFWLGDTVTVAFDSATVSEPVRQVELTWDGHGRTAVLSLGDHDSADDRTPKWVKKIRKLDARVRGLEVR